MRKQIDGMGGWMDRWEGGKGGRKEGRIEGKGKEIHL